MLFYLACIPGSEAAKLDGMSADHDTLLFEPPVRSAAEERLIAAAERLHGAIKLLNARSSDEDGNGSGANEGEAVEQLNNAVALYWWAFCQARNCGCASVAGAAYI